MDKNGTKNKKKLIQVFMYLIYFGKSLAKQHKCIFSKINA
jgi:hypothetical protein